MTMDLDVEDGTITQGSFLAWDFTCRFTLFTCNVT